MTIHRLDEMTWIDVKALDKSKTLLFVPLSPVEEHGPHLPLGTDLWGAEDFTNRALELLDERSPELDYVAIPSIPLGSAEASSTFPGTIHLRGETLARVVEDLCISFARHGFRFIVFSNHHLDPMHIKGIHEGITRAQKEHDFQAIETGGRMIYSGMELRHHGAIRELGLDPMKEVHADVTETSFILHRAPQILGNRHATLEPVWVDIGAQAMQGHRTFDAMGATEGYIGSPAKATSALGVLHVEEGGELTADFALKLHRGEAIPEIGPMMKQVIDVYTCLT